MVVYHSVFTSRFRSSREGCSRRHYSTLRARCAAIAPSLFHIHTTLFQLALLALQQIIHFAIKTTFWNLLCTYSIGQSHISMFYKDDRSSKWQESPACIWVPPPGARSLQRARILETKRVQRLSTRPCLNQRPSILLSSVCPTISLLSITHHVA